MRRLVYLTLAFGIFLAFSGSLAAQRLKTKGHAWLDSHTDPAAINVAGNWYEHDWGTIALIQAKDSREVTGSGDGWNIVGVVSGNKVYLLFSAHGEVMYSAILTAVSNSDLNGSYERGLMKQEGKGKRMDMTR